MIYEALKKKCPPDSPQKTFTHLLRYYTYSAFSLDTFFI